MSIFCMHPATGNDANDGSTWALAWKTITNGATAARIGPGDIIKMAKSPDPTSLAITAAWTNLSRAVTLASPLTANIDLCEAAWTASANVTATSSTTRKEGSYSSSLAIAAAFTTGKIAYKTLTALDLSGYQQVSLWIRTSVAIAAGVLTLRLCSDSAGETAVNTVQVPAVPGTGRWQVVTVDTGAALGASIESVALWAESDPGTPTILLDNILACKASSSPDSLTHASLISKSSLAQGGAEGWYGIKSINGTAIQLDNDTESGAGSGRGYSGVTETVTTYKRETFKTPPAAATSTPVQEVRDSGTAGSNIQFQGGYNPTTNEQDGETFFDGGNGHGYGLYLSSKSYITLNYLNFYRYYMGLYFSSSNANTVSSLSNSNNNSLCGIQVSYSYGNLFGTLRNLNNNGASGLRFDPTSGNTFSTLINVNNNLSSALYSAQSRNTITVNNVKNNAAYAVYLVSDMGTIIKSLSTAGNDSAGIYSDRGGWSYIHSALIAEAVEVTGFPSFSNGRVFSHNHDQIAGNHWIWTDGGVIFSQTATRHTESGIAWDLQVTSSNRRSDYPLWVKIAEIALSANNQATVKAWLKKSHATNVGAKLVCRGGQIAGVPDDVSATKADDTDWQELTIQFTPTEAGVVEIEAWAYYVAANGNVFVDDVTVTQA